MVVWMIDSFGTDEQRARRHQRNQAVCIHRQVVPRQRAHVQEDHVDVGDVVELARAALAHADDRKPAGVRIWSNLGMGDHQRSLQRGRVGLGALVVHLVRHDEDGLAAAVLVFIAFTLYFVNSLLARSLERNSVSSTR